MYVSTKFQHQPKVITFLLKKSMFEGFRRPWKFWNIPKFCIAHSHIIYPPTRPFSMIFEKVLAKLSCWFFLQGLLPPKREKLLRTKTGNLVGDVNPFQKYSSKSVQLPQFSGWKYKIIIWVATNQKYVWPSEESGFLTTKWRTIQWDVLFTSPKILYRTAFFNRLYPGNQRVHHPCFYPPEFQWGKTRER